MICSFPVKDILMWWMWGVTVDERTRTESGDADDGDAVLGVKAAADVAHGVPDVLHDPAASHARGWEKTIKCLLTERTCRGRRK